LVVNCEYVSTTDEWNVFRPMVDCPLGENSSTMFEIERTVKYYDRADSHFSDTIDLRGLIAVNLANEVIYDGGSMTLESDFDAWSCDRPRMATTNGGRTVEIRVKTVRISKKYVGFDQYEYQKELLPDRTAYSFSLDDVIGIAHDMVFRSGTYYTGLRILSAHHNFDYYNAKRAEWAVPNDGGYYRKKEGTYTFGAYVVVCEPLDRPHHIHHMNLD